MGVAESKIMHDKTDEEVMDDVEVDEHPLCEEIKDLKASVEDLKEVEETNAERVDLMRKLNERDEKYYVLKNKMRQQQEYMQDQINAMQEEVLYKRYEGKNYYLLYKQTFIIVEGSMICPELLSS